jgi:hypothetical protein
MKKRFNVPVFDTSEKDLEIEADGLCLTIDFDDVDHGVVEELTKLAVAALNAIPAEDWKAAIKRGRAATAAK